MSKYLYILDPAHGANTPGKRSPDGKHREYKWSREIISMILNDPRQKQYDIISPYLTVVDEPGLTNRKNTYNNIPSTKPKVVISIHNNAAGMGDKWLNARGFSIYTSIGQTKSDLFAEIFIDTFIQKFKNIKTRVETKDGDKDYEANFTVLMGNYYAMLMEVLFQDNIDDVIILNSPAFKNQFVTYFFEGLQKCEKI